MRSVELLRIPLRVSALVLLVVSCSQAQSDHGSITGFVRDPSGAMVPNARVVVRNEGTREPHAAETHELGYLAVPNLPSSFYSVTVDQTGFKKFVSTHNKLNPNSSELSGSSRCTGRVPVPGRGV